MKNLTVCGILFVLGSCTAPRGVTVEHFGVMREVMMEGKTEARVALADYEKPGFYGVGALPGLAGEILIDDGKVMVSNKHALWPERGAGAEQATLLTVAHVGQWREVLLAEGGDLGVIERAIAEAVPESLRDGAEPVPFRLGFGFWLSLHIARGACPHAATSPETEPDRWSGDCAGEIVGFFAPGRAGAMTHHGTAIHAHAFVLPVGDYFNIYNEAFVMGHVDSLVCPAGAKLFVPAQ